MLISGFTIIIQWRVCDRESHIMLGLSPAPPGIPNKFVSSYAFIQKQILLRHSLKRKRCNAFAA